MKKRPINPFQVAVHVLGWLPLVWTIIAALTQNLTINPVQESIQRFGRFAIYFLVASLSCTPIKLITGWSEPVKWRRALGLFAFLYAALHFTMLFAVDYAFNVNAMLQLAMRQPFIILGSVSFLILLAMAITSNKTMMMKLGKNWKKLHRLVYLVGLLTVLHFALAVKGTLLTLSGNILQPLILSVVVIVGLIVRLPPMQKRLVSLHSRQKS